MIDKTCILTPQFFKLVANKVHEYIPDLKAAHILDIGCGDGLVAEALSARVTYNEACDILSLL